MGVILKSKNIQKSFLSGNKTTDVLKGISMEVIRGEYLAITGPSGAGKSTLLYIIGAIDKPDKGTVEYSFGDEIKILNELSDDSLSELRNLDIGFVFQFHHLLPEFTAIENIMIPAFIKGTSQNDTKAKALQLLDSVGLSDRADYRPAQLSGGEQQRVAIARALINNPKIVFADEPTGNLDSENTSAVLDLIDDLRNKFNLTFVVATHSQDVATRADRIFKIKDGKISSID